MTVLCEHCHNPISADVRFCPHCGTARLTSPEPEAIPEPQDASVRCSFCNTVNEPGARNCSFCGGPLAAPVAAPVFEPRHDQPLSRTAILAIIIAAMLIVGSVFLWRESHRNKQPYPAAVEQGFMRGCQRTASVDTCFCVLKKLEKRYNLQQFEAFVQDLVRTQQIPNEVLHDIITCAPGGTPTT